MKILFCDSDKLTQVYISHMLKDQHELTIAASKEEITKYLKENEYGIVFSVYEFLKDNEVIELCKDIPIAIVGDVPDENIEIEHIAILNKPFVKDKVLEIIDKSKEKNMLNVLDLNDEDLKELSRETEEYLNKERLSKVISDEMLQYTIFALKNAVEAKDKYTNGHSERVAKYAKMIAERVGKSDDEINEIYYAGILHDVGKIRIPDDIINKTGRLTDSEFAFIKLHPIAGYNILKEIPNMQIVSGAKWHHERYDGTGYPDGLKGENIPEVARIIAVADAYDAMTSTRSYRQTMSQEKVREQIAGGRGTQFDPKFADVMLEMIDEDKDYEMRQVLNVVKKVLIIDDEPINLVSIKRLLEEEPEFTVYTAQSGTEGIEIILSENIDYILLDIEMPNQDGFEVLNIIRPLTGAKIIFCTANKELKTIQRAADAGVRDYLSKPFMKTALLELLK